MYIYESDLNMQIDSVENAMFSVTTNPLMFLERPSFDFIPSMFRARTTIYLSSTAPSGLI